MSEINYVQNINIIQLIYRKYFKELSWGPKLKKLLYLYYAKVIEVMNFFARMQYKSYKMVWNAENLKACRANTIHESKTPIWTVDNCCVTGSSRFIAHNDMVSFNIVNTSTDLSQIYKTYHLQEELLGEAIYNPNSSTIRLPPSKPKMKLFGYWISTLNVSSSNWMHFLSECAPMLCATMKNADKLPFGILLDADLPGQALNVIRIISDKTPMFGIQRGFKVEIEHLIVPEQNTASCVAFWPRKGSFGTGVFDFDKDALIAIREKILKHFNITPNKVNRVYVNRKTFFRFIVNNEEVEESLLSEGFELITPGKMSLQQQVASFSQASILIAQAGAALANMMFMPEGSTVICLTIESEWVNEAYFQEYAKIFNVNLIYVKGPIDNPNKYSDSKLLSVKHPMNANFTVSVDELKKVIEQIY